MLSTIGYNFGPTTVIARATVARGSNNDPDFFGSPHRAVLVWPTGIDYKRAPDLGDVGDHPAASPADVSLPRFSDRLSRGSHCSRSLPCLPLFPAGGAPLSVFRALRPDAPLITLPYTRGLLRSTV